MKYDPKSFAESLKRFNYKLVIALSVSIILFLGVFLTVWDLGYGLAVSIIYGVITLVTAAWYIFTNHGMIGKLPKEDDLPVTWDKKTRLAFLEDLTERRRRSKRAMIILIPMIVVFIYKTLDLYFFDSFRAVFSSLFGSN